jgi:hypothetical protein
MNKTFQNSYVGSESPSKTINPISPVGNSFKKSDNNKIYNDEK